MKRILVITVFAVLLISTVGATTAIAVRPPATQTGRSDVYNVAGIDGLNNGIAAGKLKVNMKANTYVFAGRNAGEDGTSYDLYCVIGGVETLFATGTALGGIVTVKGQLPADVNWAYVEGAVIKLTSVRIVTKDVYINVPGEYPRTVVGTATVDTVSWTFSLTALVPAGDYYMLSMTDGPVNDANILPSTCVASTEGIGWSSVLNGNTVLDLHVTEHAQTHYLNGGDFLLYPTPGG